MIVLDTHVWLWWLAEPSKLSPAARQAIDEAQTLGVSSVSGWEVAMLVHKGRISLDRDVAVWARQASAAARIAVQPLSLDVAVAAAQLDRAGFPGDPADRFIYATARDHRALLVTRDEALRRFDPRTTVW